MTEAIVALAALAHEHRLAAFRLLVKEGPNGLPAGVIADRLAVVPSTLSHHLAHLERAGLVRSRRVERHIFYAVDVAGMRRLLMFLTEDCCGGHPELCGIIEKRGRDDDYDLPQPEMRDVAQCPGDDPEHG